MLSMNKHDEYKNFAIGKLENILELIKEEKYDEVEQFLFCSEEGDFGGDNNYCIDFSYPSEYKRDIYDAIYTLRNLKMNGK